MAMTDFWTELDEAQRQHFLALVRAFEAQDKTLRWYHRVGQHVLDLRGQEERFKYGASWVRRVGAALNVSRDLLTKPLAFYLRFPEEADLAELEGLKATWSAVVTSLSLGDRATQLALLRQAAQEKWALSRLRKAVVEQRTQRLGDRRPRRTGRNIRAPQADAPEAELADLHTRAQAFARYLGAKWLAGEAALLACLRRAPRRQMTPALRGLLTQAEEALGAVAGRIDQLRTGLREVVGNGRGHAEP
jgi:hypothetical protein